MAAPTPSMQGKICLVTGATSGIGRVTAQALAHQGATVVLVGRNPERTAATVSRIQQETSNPHVECLMADLSAQAQVRQLAGEFQRRFARLDVLQDQCDWVLCPSARVTVAARRTGEVETRIT